MTPPSATPTLSESNERGLLWTLAAIQFTHIVDFMVMMPLGPQFTKLFAISDAQFGLLVAAYTLAAGAASLLASLVIDRFERKRLLLVLYAGFALATLACGLAPSYGLLMAARVLAGVFGGVLGALVPTIVGDAIPFARRGRAMGLIMSAFSLSTVAGVPLSLLLAEQLGWHAPFLAIAAVSAAILWAAARQVPVLQGHLQGQRAHSPLATLRRVLAERNHWRAFAVSALMVIGSFSIIPYITIYTTTNLGVRSEQIPLIYLVGGVATFFSARLWGQLSDRWGKVHTFRLLTVLAVAPMMALTHLPPVAFATILVVTTAFFVFVSGRMVPGMALLTVASQPQWRGSFMSLNSSVQSLAMGMASFVGGLLISRDAAGHVVNYGHCGWLALMSAVLSLWLIGRVQLPGLAPAMPAGTAGTAGKPGQA